MTPAGPDEAGEARARLFEQMLLLLERLAEAGPVVLVIEDMHWADQSTRDLLAFLIRNQPSLDGVLIVVTYRSDDLHRTHPLRPLLAELDRIDWVTRMELGRLTRQDTGQLVAQITGREPGEDLLAAVYRRAEGNPLFVEALVGNGEPDSGLPESLHDLLMAGAAAAAGRDAGGGPGRQRGRRADRARAADRGDRAGRRRARPGAAPGRGGQRAADRIRRLRVPARADPRGGARRAAARRAGPGAQPVRRGHRGRSGAGDAGPGRRASRPSTGTRPTTRPGRWSAPGRRPVRPSRSLAYAEQLAMLSRVLELWEQVPDAAERIGADHVAVLEEAVTGRRAGRGG